MRMWMVEPKEMCRKHLLGEHVECHMILGCIRMNKNLEGYKDIIQTSSLKQRHDTLAREMSSRGYSHKTPMDFINHDFGIVDIKRSRADLSKRCKECRVKK